MITKFATVYPGHVDLSDMGQMATPANERRYSNEHLVTVFEKTESVAKTMDDLGYHAIWLAEHHFQREGYECLPNLLTPTQVEATARRGGWGAAGVPTLEHYMKTGAWFAGPPEELVAHLKNLESRFPGLQYANMSTSIGTPKAVMLEQLAWFAKEVMPKFT
jgi:hypothetical protein